MSHLEGVTTPIDGVAYAAPELALRYRACGAWQETHVGAALRRTARRQPERLAFISDERSISFGELDTATDRLAAALRALGLAPMDRAIFQLGTNVETAVALLGCMKAGIVPVCAVPQYREVEISQIARLSGAKAYFVQSDAGSFDLVGFARRMAEAQPTIRHVITVRGTAVPGLADLDGLIAAQPAGAGPGGWEPGFGDVLSFQLSGGSTGIPKIIPRHHGEYLGHSAAWARCFGLAPDSRLIWSLPLLHNAGQLYAVMPAIAQGNSVVLMPRVDVRRMLELIELHRVTHALSIGPVAPQLAAYDGLARHDLSSLRHFGTMNRANSLERLLGVPCSNMFGITEGLLLGSSPSDPAAVRHSTQGYSGEPSDEITIRDESGREVAPGEVGELWFRGPSSLRGYFNAPVATRETLTEDGFVRSGDTMRAHRIEGRHCWSFEGRTRDTINRGGEKIGSEEVEAIISRHPAVADAKLVAMPDPIYGERGCVYLILRPGHPPLQLAELAEFLTMAGLAKFKIPERIELIEEFPVTRVGKLDKAALRRMIAEKLAVSG